MSWARGVLTLALVAGLGGGCASVNWRWPSLPWLGRATEPAVTGAPAPGEAPAARARTAQRADPALLVERAVELTREGRPLAARDLYERVVREYPDDTARAGALFGLGLLHSDPTGPLRDYRAAYAIFGRLLAEHPRSRWEADARLWRSMLNEIFAREDETVRLRGQLQRLKRIEVELDKSR
jgi:tetratricopeptide (TPR) repeat protein